MRAKDVGTAGKISNRPRHSQDAMHRTRRELKQVDRVFEHRLIVRCEPTRCIRSRLIEMRVAAAGALQLNLACADDASAHHIAAFTGRGVGTQFGRRQTRDLDVQVDAFEQRSRNPAAIALDGFGMTTASA